MSQSRNHVEAYELSSLKRYESNMARCYLELADFIKDDLLLVHEALKNLLEEAENLGKSSLIIDAEKSIWLTGEMIKKVGGG